MPKTVVSVVTSTRAEYGLLAWLMKGIRQSRSLALDLVVTGTHLSADHGNTLRFIEEDGFAINAKINILSGNGVKGVGNTAAAALAGFTDYFEGKKPAAVVLLGDRYEILAIAQAAVLASVPVVHLHGGEITEGANDDLFRHAITKLSSLHFTSNKQHRRRVIQMGETPARVKISGALGIENIKRMALLDRGALETKFNCTFRKTVFLITFHPATLDKQSPELQFANLLKAVLTFKDTTFVISKANADAGGDKINALIDGFAEKHKNCLVSFSFGQLNYLSLMKAADVVIGNSSSGILEAPSLYTPTVNIGSRQKGRMSAKSVIHCSTGKEEIIRAIAAALKLKKNRKLFANPYDHGRSSAKIVNVLEKTDFSSLLPKKFHDLK